MRFAGALPFIVVVLLMPLVITIQNYLLGINHFWGGNETYYNNFLIFKYSFFHLLENKNLYVQYHTEYGDYFKYSPTFALFMGTFAWLPNLAGLFLWNAVNCLVFYLALKSLGYDFKRSLFLLAFVFCELVVATMASQSNALVAGLMVLAFASLEKNRPGAAGFFIAAGVFIKLFAIVAVLLFLFHPKKGRMAGYLALWMLVLALCPLVVTGPASLLAQYGHWLQLLKNDHAISMGISAFSLFNALLPGGINKSLILALGLLLLLLPLVKRKEYANYHFRLWYFSALLIWIVIFNHKGESPTYIIAITGCALWASYALRSTAFIVLAALTWLLTSFIKTDIFNGLKSIINMEIVNALMPVVVFGMIVYNLLWPSVRFGYNAVAAPENK